jgi:hypothetical protein
MKKTISIRIKESWVKKLEKTGGKKHTKMAILLWGHLQETTNITTNLGGLCSVTASSYERIVFPDSGEKAVLSSEWIGYMPDFMLWDDEKSVWIEIEADPFNIFKKVGKLLVFSKQNFPIPDTLIFGIPELKTKFRLTTTISHPTPYIRGRLRTGKPKLFSAVSSNLSEIRLDFAAIAREMASNAGIHDFRIYEIEPDEIKVKRLI